MRELTLLVSSKLSVQQSVFMDKVDSLKSSLLSCYDILHFIFCIYRAQEVLLLNEHTKMFSDQKTVFSIDVMAEELDNKDSKPRYPMSSESCSWKVGACAVLIRSIVKVF